MRGPDEVIGSRMGPTGGVGSAHRSFPCGTSPGGPGVLRELGRLLIELIAPIEPAETDRPDPLADALAFAAHELRGPLVAAKAALERVLLDPESPDVRSLLTRSVQELDRLARDVGQVLEWAVEP